MGEDNIIDVWIFDFTNDFGLDKYIEVLADDELYRSKKFVFENDRNRYILRKIILRLLLSEYLGYSPEKIVFSYNEAGKPELNNKIYFNCTKSKEIYSIAISKYKNVGIDIEKKDELKFIEELKKQICTKDEIRYIKNINFFELWTFKESVLKAVGCGIGNSLQDLSITDVIDNKIIFNDKTWNIYKLKNLKKEFVGTVCSEGYRRCLINYYNIMDIKMKRW